MVHRTLEACVADLEQAGQLVRITHPVNPFLQIAAIQRRAFRRKAPALLFTHVQGCAFPMLANLYGTKERIRYIFRDTLPLVEHLFSVKANPRAAFRHPVRSLGLPKALWNMWPRTVKQGSVLQCRTSLSQLPQLTSWPMDGGAFITLPLVYTEKMSPQDKQGPQRLGGFSASNLGMYRVQISGNAYVTDQEAGLHYQIHRGIADHHAEALRQGQPLRVNIFVGGPPAMTLAAVMPLPEALPEVLFAGVLGGFRMPFVRPTGGALPVLADADFCISGTLLPQRKAEGPFGDHLGYYSLQHDFPCVRVDAVYHRPGAIWPFTSVGRPPQEDTMFGEFIHDLTAELVPQVFSGVHAVHAVDAAGVHPLLLAVGSERYVPDAVEREPQELLTCAMNVLGTTQTALAKYVLMAAHEDNQQLNVHDVPIFFRHMLERTDFRRDLHFITRTTIDTLDYTGSALNAGSKLIWLAAGSVKRTLATALPPQIPLPEGFARPHVMAAGILVLEGPKHCGHRGEQDPAMNTLAEALAYLPDKNTWGLVVVVDDAVFATRNWNNFLWTSFTRSDPATDSYGVGATIHAKHWGCDVLIVDARLKAFQAPPLEDDPETERSIDALAVKGGPLYGYV
ncbi:MAG: UbiD family decarboxylase [Desulfovibrionaceae bacterium]